MKPIVFLGPTLSAKEARAILPCEIWPPARRGDVWRALQKKPPALVLIDGVFESTPSVWHHEILSALDAGVPVYGASSMGALRAAELHIHGMIGVGEIFESYRDGGRRDDSDVALLHANAEHGYQQLTVPLVNVAPVLKVARKILTSAERSMLSARAAALHYQQRSWANWLEPLAPENRAALVKLLQQSPKWDLKAADARACLKRAKTSKPRAPRPSRLPAHARRKRIENESLALCERADVDVLAHEGVKRLLLAGWAKSLGIEAPAKRVTFFFEQLSPRMVADQRLALAETLALEECMVQSAPRLIPDGPSWSEGLVTEAHARRLR